MPSATTLAAAHQGTSTTFPIYANAAAASGVDLKGSRAVAIFGNGTLAVTEVDGTARTIPDAGQYVFLPVELASITGGTATNIMVLF